jgi:hypothetical protein
MHDACPSQGCKEPFPEDSAASSETRNPQDNGLYRGADYIPSLQIRTAWNRDGMVRACDEIANFALRCIQRMYDCIASRIQGDAYYLKAISSLVCIPPSIHYMISQTIYFRLMHMLAFFVVIPKQLQRTMSNHLASMSILASTSERSMTFCTNFNTYIQWWSVIIVWLSPLVTNIFRAQMLMYQSHTKIQS